MITFKFRETPEKKRGNPEPNPIFRKQTKKQTRFIKTELRIQKDRCRDSMEVVLTNRVDCVALVK